jgi:hypothetical protein
MSMTGDYSNRSDLRDAATRTARFTGQTYGQAGQQQAAQQAVRPGASPTSVQAQQMAARRVAPGQRSLNRPTERPNEPITAGAPFGPGPGPEAISMPTRIIPRDKVLEQLVALHNAFPNDRLRRLIQNVVERN